MRPESDSESLHRAFALEISRRRRCLAGVGSNHDGLGIICQCDRLLNLRAASRKLVSIA